MYPMHWTKRTDGKPVNSNLKTPLSSDDVPLPLFFRMMLAELMGCRVSLSRKVPSIRNFWPKPVRETGKNARNSKPLRIIFMLSGLRKFTKTPGGLG